MGEGWREVEGERLPRALEGLGLGDAVRGALPLREALGLRLGVDESVARGEALACEAEGESVCDAEGEGGAVLLRVPEAQPLAVGSAGVGVTLMLALGLLAGD